MMTEQARSGVNESDRATVHFWVGVGMATIGTFIVWRAEMEGDEYWSETRNAIDVPEFVRDVLSPSRGGWVHIGGVIPIFLGFLLALWQLVRRYDKEYDTTKSMDRAAAQRNGTKPTWP